MKLLLDTCVLIDYFGRREPFFEACNALRVAEWFGEFELWASAKSFTDVFYVLSRRVPSKDIQRAFCASASFLHVVSIDGNDIVRAAQEGWEDFEDCLIAQAARKIGADWIVTRDADGFARSRVPVMAPAAVTDWLRRERHRAYASMTITREMIEAAQARVDGAQVDGGSQ